MTLRNLARRAGNGFPTSFSPSNFTAFALPSTNPSSKATDENLTSENWSLILDVCDRVSASPSGPANAVAALIKRLSHRNANVQLYTLELANALSQNCGPPIHRELSSRSFTDALIRLAGDRNAHQQVKGKVLERMEEWTEQFRGDPDLGIMEGAFERLKRSNPALQAPDKPRKREIEDVDRKKEDEELQMALALSLKEGTKKEEKKQETGQEAVEKKEEPARGTTAATVSRVRALYDFTPSEAGELAFRKGDVIAVLESVYKDWWKGSLRGNTGIFPLNYVEKLQDPTKEEMEKDAMMEGEVFAQIRNVEKLLALLSVRSEGGMGAKDAGTEEEIQELYNQTLAIRPKLIELIGKYSQKKDDFTSLNEKFIKARRDYEALLESSMSQPPAGYGYPGGRQPSQPYQAYPPQGGYPPQHTPAPYAQQRPQPQQQQPSYAAPPPQQQQQQQYYNPPPSAAPTDPYAHANGSSSAFHFLPSGAPPPQQQQVQTPQVQLPPQSETPKPLSTAVPSVDSPYSPQPSFSNRPQSIHTLNSGNPQELATSGYESPIDNRHSYPSAQFPPQQAQPTSQPYETKPYAGLPSQQPGFGRPQRQASFESAPQPTPGYPQENYPPAQQGQQQPAYPPQQHGYAPQPQGQPPQNQQQQFPPQQGQQSHPPQPQQAPPAPPGQQPPGQYRAYSPNVQGSAMPPPQQPQGQGGYPGLPGQGQAAAAAGGGTGGDEDYYR
ncbi:putative class E vacuolar protein-sorting machinery protein HSE1 [Elsinoe fawcettii]|nr:putative class E vacuolar protein-sorting machinery protein HSE1 [Elsinoe fawcettii]